MATFLVPGGGTVTTTGTSGTRLFPGVGTLTEVAVVAGGGAVHSLAGYGGLAGPGGIAGPHGGLAG